jgi:hypothetical protein
VLDRASHWFQGILAGEVKAALYEAEKQHPLCDGDCWQGTEAEVTLRDRPQICGTGTQGCERSDGSQPKLDFVGLKPELLDLMRTTNGS